ncbi:MAG: FtsQ-type POTRA domain-containing protein [Intrasporangium sp.]|uniref:cell division protein FtsQ/DivIB n=1 Tax=Intrasporangium sp. TaxID=1925024 RepID=UPI002648B91A|nr:FtsQ-type POTRA domain-containing protein [Intrasporangium sp.]MDN5795234.1 FtsQ-type POTRA domain-containing protein [Intrasporangium sp.]
MRIWPRRRRQTSGLSSARARFEARAARARRRPFLLAAALVASLLLAAGLIWVGWMSPLLAATTVRVEGVSTGDARAVREVARVPLGGPLMRLDTDAVTERLEAGRSWTDIRVSRSLPHSVVIKVTPRKPALVLRNPQGQLELVDEGGVRFGTVSTPPEGVPVVTAGSADVTNSGLSAALAALHALPASVRSQVSDMAVGAADQVRFTLTEKYGRRTVVWGSSGQEQSKARLVTILLQQPGTTVDVSVPSAPVTR